MHLIHGIYRFKPQCIGTRRDFCNACLHETHTEQIRAFWVWHFFFIPLVPLWWRAEWQCTSCGADPRARYRSSPSFWKVIAGVSSLIFIVPTIVEWESPVSPDGAVLNWVLRFALPLAACFLLYFAFVRKTKSVDLLNEERRQRVIPLETDHCLYCESLLNSQPYVYCPHCRIRVYGTYEETSDKVPGTGRLDL